MVFFIGKTIGKKIERNIAFGFKALNRTTSINFKKVRLIFLQKKENQIYKQKPVMKFLFLNVYFLGAMYLESGLKSATEFFTKLAFDEEVCSHDNF